jgi:hypothetical protein
MTKIIRPMKTTLGRRLMLSRFAAVHIFLITCVSWIGCTSLRNASLVDQAEQLAQEGRYLEAIETYRKHIEERLGESARPEWENPHFYLLQIVDLQLELAHPEDALRTCSEAQQNGVELALISDRYRAIATWYENRGDLIGAFQVLKANRERDPLLFDAMLDRVGRAITASEANAGSELQE